MGPASLDLVGGRVRRFDAVIDGATGTRLIVDSKPIDPGEPGAWVLETAGRRRLESLGRLRPLGERLVAGVRWPATQAAPAGSRASEEWPPFSGAAGAESAFTLRAVWVFDGAGPSQENEQLAEHALGVLTELRREVLRGRIDGRFDKRLALEEVVGLALVEQQGDAFERIDAQHTAWRSAVDRAWGAAGEPPRLLWAAAEPRLLDRVAPGAPSALVLLDGRGVILAATPVEPGSLRAELCATLVSGLPLARP
jgi:hypothetical protein